MFNTNFLYQFCWCQHNQCIGLDNRGGWIVRSFFVLCDRLWHGLDIFWRNLLHKTRYILISSVAERFLWVFWVLLSQPVEHQYKLFYSLIILLLYGPIIKLITLSFSANSRMHLDKKKGLNFGWKAILFFIYYCFWIFCRFFYFILF
jgi:hypothetical protein